MQINQSINESYHFSHSYVRVLKQSFPLIREFSHSSTINYPMITSETNINHVSRHPLLIPPLWNSLQLTYRHNTHLWRQYQWISHNTTNSSNIRETNCSIIQLIRCQFSLNTQISQSLDLLLNRQQTECLNILNVRNDKTIWRVNSQADIVIIVNLVLKLTHIWKISRINSRILLQSHWESLYQQPHHCHLLITCFQCLTKLLTLSQVNLFMII